MKSQTSKKGLGSRLCLLLWSLGLMGQIGWNVEGQWFNNFVYEKIGKDPAIITAMLICSATATTVSMFLFGTVTDRTGNRRNLINIGYIVWGALTIAFGFTEFLSKDFFIVACICVVLGDMLVSFFGSMGADSGFGTWTTDIMTEDTRGQIGGIIAVVCVLGTILGSLLGSVLVGKDNNYIRLFTVIGSILILFGIVSIFLFNKKDDVAPSVRGSFKQQFFSIFKLKQLFSSKELLLVYIATAIYFTGFDTYFTYLGNYLIHYLGYTADMIGLIQGVPLVLAMLIAVPISNLINKNLHFPVTLIAVVSAFVGMIFMAPLSPKTIDTSKAFNFNVFFAILLLGIGYVIMLQTTKAWTKELCPTDSKGQFEGIWCVSYALLPMIFGSLTSHFVIKETGLIVIKALGGPIEYIPTGTIFIIGVLISSFSLIPLYFASKKHKERLIAKEQMKNKLKKTQKKKH